MTRKAWIRCLTRGICVTAEAQWVWDIWLGLAEGTWNLQKIHTFLGGKQLAKAYQGI